ncbi:methylated-DNA--[protein]-cysteine S-methyltransferase [Porphyromonas crevioricanis]|uniref:methylated-DNA--[protein]-cysteine S-methyltransferase n=2 Tax=Porphyromonas crevioricanis TaxID=393921 RepID=A0A2X4PV92_9PORP|nr:methylated-DNA--[protein]-cysteine S-methyltransferase [Porphyromonas crevioricanis]GAD05220.1 ada regulatory protein, internal deletion [Porphyromonas crevioricanis JCM 15906]GAD06446.1 ada regulatory protein, internal deletion [Porphyromonas crevioricanis JCM 13913]SJZ99434.1 O-6-methylguanine DNA methyltransferase [Porphyromonas crevioricanis]SQH72469.1 Regulatory protein of adaptative response [Porphyromonas crevioricanis]
MRSVTLLSAKDLATCPPICHIVFRNSERGVEKPGEFPAGVLRYAGFDWQVYSLERGEKQSLEHILISGIKLLGPSLSVKDDVEGTPLSLADFPQETMGLFYYGDKERNERLTQPKKIVPLFEPMSTASLLEQQVWSALCRIPIGCCCSYSAIAEFIGRPRAVRAVASAIGRNPLAPIVPCHRVVRSDGSIGGYYYGTDIKQSILAYERSIAK